MDLNNIYFYVLGSILVSLIIVKVSVCLYSFWMRWDIDKIKQSKLLNKITIFEVNDIFDSWFFWVFVESALTLAVLFFAGFLSKTGHLNVVVNSLIALSLLIFAPRFTADVVKGVKYKSSTGKFEEIERLKARIDKLEGK